MVVTDGQDDKIRMNMAVTDRCRKNVETDDDCDGLCSYQEQQNCAE